MCPSLTDAQGFLSPALPVTVSAPPPNPRPPLPRCPGQKSSPTPPLSPHTPQLPHPTTQRGPLGSVPPALRRRGAGTRAAGECRGLGARHSGQAERASLREAPWDLGVEPGFLGSSSHSAPTLCWPARARGRWAATTALHWEREPPPTQARDSRGQCGPEGSSRGPGSGPRPIHGCPRGHSHLFIYSFF